MTSKTTATLTKSSTKCELQYNMVIEVLVTDLNPIEFNYTVRMIWQESKTVPHCNWMTIDEEDGLIDSSNSHNINSSSMNASIISHRQGHYNHDNSNGSNNISNNNNSSNNNSNSNNNIEEVTVEEDRYWFSSSSSSSSSSSASLIQFKNAAAADRTLTAFKMQWRHQ